MDTQTPRPLTNAEIIDQRTRPELPRELSKFNPFWIRLPRKPLGPPYNGDGKFEVNRIPREIMDDIYHEALAGKTLDQIMTKVVTEYNLFVHAETVCNHIPKDSDIVRFTATKWDTRYVKEFEERHGIYRFKKGAENGPLIKELYKPFIIWAIENGYGYWQIKSLPVAGNTIRQWANGWGYATDERVYSRTPDLTGKKKRTTVTGDIDAVGHLPGEETYDEGQVIMDKSIGRLQFPRRKKFTGAGQIGLDFSVTEELLISTYTTEQLCAELSKRGYEVTLGYIFPVIITTDKEVGSLGQEKQS